MPVTIEINGAHCTNTSYKKLSGEKAEKWTPIGSLAVSAMRVVIATALMECNTQPRLLATPTIRVRLGAFILTTVAQLVR